MPNQCWHTNREMWANQNHKIYWSNRSPLFFVLVPSTFCVNIKINCSGAYNMKWVRRRDKDGLKMKLSLAWRFSDVHNRLDWISLAWQCNISSIASIWCKRLRKDAGIDSKCLRIKRMDRRELKAIFCSRECSVIGSFQIVLTSSRIEWNYNKIHFPPSEIEQHKKFLPHTTTLLADIENVCESRVSCRGKTKNSSSIRRRIYSRNKVTII